MKSAASAFAVFVVVMLLLLPLTAGCLSIPSPDSPKKAAAVTPAATSAVSHTEQVTQVTTTPKTTRIPIVTATTGPVVSRVQADGGKYETGTCAEQGFAVSPGEECKGSYLAATDTFSCCSVRPVAVESGNVSVKVALFNLSVNLDDNPGSITP